VFHEGNAEILRRSAVCVLYYTSLLIKHRHFGIQGISGSNLYVGKPSYLLWYPRSVSVTPSPVIEPSTPVVIALSVQAHFALVKSTVAFHPMLLFWEISTILRNYTYVWMNCLLMIMIQIRNQNPKICLVWILIIKSNESKVSCTHSILKSLAVFGVHHTKLVTYLSYKFQCRVISLIVFFSWTWTVLGIWFRILVLGEAFGSAFWVVG